MRVPLIAGNWKMQGSRALVAQFLPALSVALPSGVEVALFLPYIFLFEAQVLLQNTALKLGAQNMAEHPQGAYTGEISAAMLQECGCDYVLLGHSERRQYYHETDDTCRQKTLAAQASGLIPILCLGETAQQRERGETFAVIENQLALIIHDRSINPTSLILAYEPVWAIGSGQAATPALVQAIHAFIRQKLTAWLGDVVAQRIRILYGGSVKPENAAALLTQPDIDGLLVGGAALSLQSFIEIINVRK